MIDGIPTAYYFGQEGLHSILVIDILGPSLEDLFDMCSRKFSIKTVAMLAKQMVNTETPVSFLVVLKKKQKKTLNVTDHSSTINS